MDASRQKETLDELGEELLNARDRDFYAKKSEPSVNRTTTWLAENVLASCQLALISSKGNE